MTHFFHSKQWAVFSVLLFSSKLCYCVDQEGCRKRKQRSEEKLHRFPEGRTRCSSGFDEHFPLLCSTLGSDREAQSHLLHASPGTGLGRACRLCTSPSSVTAVGDASLTQRLWHLKKLDKVKRPTGAWQAVTFLSEASSLPSPKSTCVIISASAPRGTN